MCRDKECSDRYRNGYVGNTEQLQRNRYYLSAIIDAIDFLTVNQLPFRGGNDGFDSMSGDGCGLFLSFFEYTLRKDPALARIAQSIPHNARYTSHDIQNNIIDIEYYGHRADCERGWRVILHYKSGWN